MLNLLRQNTEMGYFLNRQNEFKEFSSQEKYLEFCNNVCCVTEVLGHLAFFLWTQNLA
jgi:hypothetical protein